MYVLENEISLIFLLCAWHIKIVFNRETVNNIFIHTDAAYSQRLLASAKSLYDFANAHKGIYNKGPISDATSYYG